MKDVSFRYPTNPNIAVLVNFSINIHAGKTVGLLGPKGCGKSTVINLMERFYETTIGSVVSKSKTNKKIKKHSENEDITSDLHVVDE